VCIRLYIFTLQRMDLSEGSGASKRCAVCIKERHLLSPCSVAPAAHIYDEILHDDF